MRRRNKENLPSHDKSAKDLQNNDRDIKKNAQKTKVLDNQKNQSSNLILYLLLVIIAAGAMAFIGIGEYKRCLNEIKEIQATLENQNLAKNQTDHIEKRPRTFTSYFLRESDDHLHHVYKVLDALGYKKEPNSKDWDLFWAHDYPFDSKYNDLKNMKPYQRVNHYPNCGCITAKVELSTTTMKYSLPAFKLPKDKEKFLNYTLEHPEKKFVLKNNHHRHISIKAVEEIPLDANDSFVQEFMSEPLLVGGHMFDIGIYTIITSVDPLRVYIYSGEIALRFCPVPYEPFDASNLGKYVVADDYKPIWEIPKIEFFYKTLGYGYRDSLNAYLTEECYDVSIIWKQIEEAIAIAIRTKQSLIVDHIKGFPSKRNFFEMMRFDFLVDNKLNVILLEANMSPNLSTSRFTSSQLLYEQVLFNLFGLVGLGDRVHKSLDDRTSDDKAMETSLKNVLTMANRCSSSICQQSCDDIYCKLCKGCLLQDEELLQDLLAAHKEHLNRGDCKRIVPPTMVPFALLPKEVSTYTRKDQLMYLWFQEKCNMDSTWC